jgi:homoserine kinase type II
MCTTDIYINKILSEYFLQRDWNISNGGNGVNNTTRFIENNGQKFVLRVYETHQDESKVEYEHHVLIALNNTQGPLLIPKPVSTGNGSTFIKTEDGKLAAMFYHIEGSNPTLEKPSELISFGRAAGQLTLALEKVNTVLEPVYSPYYEIENTHPSCSLAYVLDLCMNPEGEFLKYSAELARIGEQLAVVSKSVPKLKELPHQLIHGDLNVSNILADSTGEIIAILDFEFVTRDLRVMESAVCLSDLLHSTDDQVLAWERVNHYLSGYGSAIKLTSDEVNVIPMLILLRRMDVFIHFLGRYLDGINSIDIVDDQIYKAVSQVDWNAANAEKLLHMCSEWLL